MATDKAQTGGTMAFRVYAADDDSRPITCIAEYGTALPTGGAFVSYPSFCSKYPPAASGG
ncbi:MAG: hypothetical protein WC829_16030 [Hyphomicrobium sp.]|jgi:hypothetical protein